MASHLTHDEVAHIADLARLDLSPSELETFAPQLADILAYAATVQQADTTGVDHDRTAEPLNAGTSEPRHLEPTWRPDSPAPSIARADVIREAPDGVPESGLFRVSKVL